MRTIEEWINMHELCTNDTDIEVVKKDGEKIFEGSLEQLRETEFYKMIAIKEALIDARSNARIRFILSE